MKLTFHAVGDKLLHPFYSIDIGVLPPGPGGPQLARTAIAELLETSPHSNC